MGSLKRAFRAVWALLAVSALPAFMACGGGHHSPPPPTAPSITTPPANQTVLEGNAATFTVVAAGTAPLSYQWNKGGTAIGGATSASYTTPATALADSGSSFTVTVSNSAGTITSPAATLTVYPNPSIASFTAAPATLTVGGSATLSFAFTGGTGSIDNGVGAVTSGTDVVVTPAATTTYTLTVDNGHGTTKTATATVTVVPAPLAPAITVASTVSAGKTGLTASVAAQSGMTYAWSITNGTLTAGGTSNQITFTAGAAGTPLTLVCTVSNAAGASASSPTTSVTVVAPPVATSLTASTTAPLYGASVNLTAVFSGGTGSIDHSVGAVTSGTPVSTSALTAATTFTLTVTNAANDTATTSVTVTPKTVTVSVSPATKTVTVGDSVTFTATVTNAVNSGVTWTATGGTFASNVWTAPATAGSYTITATSLADSSKTATATVTVAPAPVAPSVSAPSTVSTGKTGLAASVVAQSGMTYTWSITNGTITAGGTTNQITFTAGAAGTPLTLACTVSNAAGASASSPTASVTVVALPVATSLTASSLSPLYGATVDLTAVFSGGTGSIDHGVGAVTSGTPVTTSSLTAATTFTLTVTNAANDTATRTVTVTPQAVVVGAILGPTKLTVSKTFTYSASISGAVNTTLNWYVDNVQGGNATVGTITAGGLYTAPATAGSHTIKAVAAADGTTSSSLSLTLYPQPDATITAPSSVASGATGLSASVPAQAAGTIYGWSITNGTGSGSISSSPTANPVTFSAGNTGTFTLNCSVTNPAGDTASSNVTITVVAAPVINSFTANPTGVVSGDAVVLSFSFAGGSGAIDQGVGAVTSGTDVTVHPTTTTTYTLTVTPTVGSAITQSVTVNVSTPLSFTTNLAATGSANVGSSFTFTVAVSGTPAPTQYEWYRNGTLVQTTSSASYTLNPVSSGDSGNWYVIARNGITSATSSTMALTVNTGYTISGHLYAANTGSSTPIANATVTLGGTSSATTTTDSNGSYVFGGLFAGAYTVTPSLTGAGVSTWFLPGSQNVTVTSSNQTADFQVDIGYSVSGTVAYSGSQSGRIYLVLSGGNGASNGVSIASPGSFTIRGVPPGDYTLTAYMDIVGLGVRNASDPTNSATINVTVSSAPVTGTTVNLVDPATVTLSSSPSFQGIVPFNSGAFVNYSPLTASNVETATSYDLQWSTSSSFTSVAGALSIKAQGDQNPMAFTSGLTNGTTYYFRMRGNVGSTHGPWGSVSSGVTIGAATGANTVAGTITLPVTPTGPLAVALVPDNGAPIITWIASPSTSQAYSIAGVASGSYSLYAILDQNQNGVIDPGDLSNTGGNGMPVTVAGNLSNQNLTLSGASASAQVTTQHWKQSGANSGEGYNLNFRVNGNAKLPVNVTLQLGSTGLVDIGVNDGGDRYQYWVNSLRPTVGDSYTFTVGYSDGTSSAPTATVGGVLDAFAQNLAPTTGSSSSTTPTFSWNAPATPPASYTYMFWIYPQGTGGTLWQVPGNNSNANGLSSSVTSLVWGVDPTDGSNTPTVSTLTSGTTYTWTVSVRDAAGNEAQQSVEYKP